MACALAPANRVSTPGTNGIRAVSVEGRAAADNRRLSMSAPLAASRFGAVLDMVTDRFCTSLLLMVVGHLTEAQGGMPVAAALVALDFISHWYAMYA